MKKIITLCLFAGIINESSAQMRFSVFAGPQVTTAKYSVNGKKQPTTPKYGFQAGVNCEVPFEGNLYFSPAVFYSLKGYKVKFNRQAFPPDTAAINNNTTIHTVELAVLLQYNFGKQPDHFFIKLGPSLDFQLFGKEKFTKKNNTVIDRSMVFNFANYGHYGANMLLQFGFIASRGIMIFGQYVYGIGNINNADGGPAIRHRAYNISIGKFF